MKFYIKVALFISLFNLSNITSADTDKNAELFGSLPDILDVAHLTKWKIHWCCANKKQMKQSSLKL